MKQEMMGWQWHELDHMQNICNSLQTDNYAVLYTLQWEHITQNDYLLQSINKTSVQIKITKK